MPLSFFQNKTGLFILLFIAQFITASAQTNLLLNGGFEDVNTCTEYSAECGVCLLYTSDAADERSSVDLGGRRIIKKKTT